MPERTTDQIAESLPFEDLQEIVQAIGALPATRIEGRADTREPYDKAVHGLLDAVNRAFDKAIGSPAQAQDRGSDGGVDQTRDGATADKSASETDENVIKGARRLYGLFKFLSDDTRGRPTWERLRREIPGLDRDRVVLHLWTLLEDRFPEQVRSVGASLPYHRVWLADRFLERYDVRRSRRALGGGRAAGWAQVALLALLAGLFWARRQAVPESLPWLAEAWPVAAAVGLGFLGVAGGLAWSFRKALDALDAPGLSKLDRCLEPVLHAFQSLLPRLAAAGLVGLVILASSQELLELLTCKLADSSPIVQVLVVVLPLAGGYLYLLLEMTRRVHPLPAVPHLLGRAFDVWATALAHALAITLVAERGLGKILGLAGPFPGWAAFRIAVFVFIIGLVVNLVWAETPVTQPL